MFLTITRLLVKQHARSAVKAAVVLSALLKMVGGLVGVFQHSKSGTSSLMRTNGKFALHKLSSTTQRQNQTLVFPGNAEQLPSLPSSDRQGLRATTAPGHSWRNEPLLYLPMAQGVGMHNL